MSDDKHTPGPWFADFPPSVDPEWAHVQTKGGSIIANVNADKRQEANARLIAAAPELLEALDAVHDAFQRGIIGTRERAFFDWDATFEALAKAEGHYE